MMMNRSKSALHVGAALCGLSVAFSGYSTALAAPRHQTSTALVADAQMKALEDRIAALERVVALQQQQQLRAEAVRQQTAAGAEHDAVQIASETQMKVEQLPAQRQASIAAAHPGTDKIYVKGVSVTLGGFFEAAGIYRSRDETADIASSFARIPFANDRASHTGETRITARQTKISALVEGDITQSTRAYGFGEIDFQGAAQNGNSIEAGGYNPRLRQLYVQLDLDKPGLSVMAGQAWSLLTTNNKGIVLRTETPPPTIDAQFVPGFVWTRQPQVRLTKRIGQSLWFAVSIEGPQTTFGGSGAPSGVTVTSTQLPTSGYNSANNYSLNKYPDLIGKAAWDGTIGGHSLHAELFGMMRSFYDRVSIAPSPGTQAAVLGLVAGTRNRSSTGGGYGASLTAQLVPKLLDVQASILRGRGLGRYGSGQLPDVTVRPDGELWGIGETLWLAGATLHATRQLDLYLYGGGERESPTVYRPTSLTGTSFGYGTLPGSNNAGCIVEGGTCTALTRSISQITGGFWDRVYQGPFGRVQIGAQYSRTVRKTFADAQGLAPTAKENAIFGALRYYPF